jgi:hypothetical protein
VIITSVIVRALCLIILFPLIGAIVFSIFKDKGSNASLITTSVIILWTASLNHLLNEEQQ